ncbi:MAG: hypothetical protein QM791_04320 [Ferruginibacter sp.]
MKPETLGLISVVLTLGFLSAIIYCLNMLSKTAVPVIANKKPRFVSERELYDESFVNISLAIDRARNSYQLEKCLQEIRSFKSRFKRLPNCDRDYERLFEQAGEKYKMLN